MTLIPLISSIMTAPEATTAPAGTPTALTRNSYGSDHGRHPVAALLAVGLPAALVAAVALSPMVIDTVPKADPMVGTLIKLPPPPPPPEPTPDAKPTPRTASATDTVKPVFETMPSFENRVVEGPVIVDLRPLDPDPPARPADPPPAPKLVFAELDPRYAGAFQPDYPASEQRREIEGVAKVRVLVGTDGRVKAVELVSTDSPGFFAETKRRALTKWRFTPATRGGMAEESWKTMTVRFEIRAA
jgi:protein TonB